MSVLAWLGAGLVGCSTVVVYASLVVGSRADADMEAGSDAPSREETAA